MSRAQGGKPRSSEACAPLTLPKMPLWCTTLSYNVAYVQMSGLGADTSV